MVNVKFSRRNEWPDMDNLSTQWPQLILSHFLSIHCLMKPNPELVPTYPEEWPRSMSWCCIPLLTQFPHGRQENFCQDLSKVQAWLPNSLATSKNFWSSFCSMCRFSLAIASHISPKCCMTISWGNPALLSTTNSMYFATWSNNPWELTAKDQTKLCPTTQTTASQDFYKKHLAVMCLHKIDTYYKSSQVFTWRNINKIHNSSRLYILLEDFGHFWSIEFLDFFPAFSLIQHLENWLLYGSICEQNDDVQVHMYFYHLFIYLSNV